VDLAEEFRDFRNAVFGAIHLLCIFVLCRPFALAMAFFRTSVQFLPQAGFDELDIRRIQIE
jgi:hypothetical protein